MPCPSSSGVSSAAFVIFGLVEAIMLGALTSSELLGAAWGARLRSDAWVPRAAPGPRLASLELFLGHVFVGVVTPYAVLAMLAPRSDWLVSLATGMALAGGSSGGAALLVGVAAGLLASRSSLPAARLAGTWPTREASYGQRLPTAPEAA